MDDSRQKLSPTVVLADAFKSASQQRTEKGWVVVVTVINDAMINRPY